MGLVQHRAKRLESVISICLLAMLFLIWVGVFIKQFDVDMGRFGIDAASTQRTSAKLEVDEKEKIALSSFLPAGFEILSDIEVYDWENLYEKINGKAPFYTESGFKKLLTQRFAGKDDENLSMELYVYDMGNVRNAFSVYSLQRRAEAKALPAFAFGYRTGNAVYFVHGEYYIEVVGYSVSDELVKAMVETAQKIRRELTVDEITEIAELKLFPTDNIVEGSCKLYLANAFGFDGLTDILTCQYEIDGETITAFLSKRAETKEAEASAESYRNFLIENGAEVTNAIDNSFEGTVLDFYDTTEIIFTTGPVFGGIHEAESQKSAEKLAEILINKLNPK